MDKKSLQLTFLTHNKIRTLKFHTPKMGIHEGGQHRPVEGPNAKTSSWANVWAKISLNSENTNNFYILPHIHWGNKIKQYFKFWTFCGTRALKNRQKGACRAYLKNQQFFKSGLNFERTLSVCQNAVSPIWNNQFCSHFFKIWSCTTFCDSRNLPYIEK